MRNKEGATKDISSFVVATERAKSELRKQSAPSLTTASVKSSQIGGENSAVIVFRHVSLSLPFQIPKRTSILERSGESFLDSRRGQV
jgi:hypothetical protein